MHLRTPTEGSERLGTRQVFIFFRLANHSCTSCTSFHEVETGRHLIVASVRDIYPGEEITVTYGNALWFISKCGWSGSRRWRSALERDLDSLRLKFKSRYSKSKATGNGEVKPAQIAIAWVKQIQAEIEPKGGGAIRPLTEARTRLLGQRRFTHQRLYRWQPRCQPKARRAWCRYLAQCPCRPRMKSSTLLRFRCVKFRLHR
ncbi:SET domain [Phytophthora cactorum]|nr:SET domain [Phytophthora cactorum]